MNFEISQSAKSKARDFIDNEEAAQRIFAAQEWVDSQDWSRAEEPSPVQVALKRLGRVRKENQQ